MKTEEFDKLWVLTPEELELVEHHVLCQKEKHLGEMCGCEVAFMLEKIKKQVVHD